MGAGGEGEGEEGEGEDGHERFDMQLSMVKVVLRESGRILRLYFEF